MKQLNRTKIKDMWSILLIIKYLFSVYLIFLGFRTTQNGTYLFAGLIELIVIILASNFLLGLNKIAGHTIHFILMLLFNCQMLVLCFAGSFTTAVMLTNIGFLHDLQGKFGDYLRLIIPMIACTCIPAKRFLIKKRGVVLSAIVAICMESLVLLMVGITYSPLGNVYQLYLIQKNYQKMATLTSGVSADTETFYHSGIDDYVRKPDALVKNPNIVLIFVEGLSENVIMDERNIMPNVGKVESESISFANYYNHTFATLKGLIGQLYSGYQMANLDDNVLVSMQSILKNNGYSTSFVNTEPTNVDFTNYLTGMKFDNLVTDMDLVDYKAEYIHDKDAFDLLYDTIEQQSTSGKPFFTAIYTFGTHVSLDSQGEKFADGTDTLLNRFYNLDYQFGQFLEKFQKSNLYENTILIFTTDHATYADEDFVSSFPNHERIHTELDKIPLIIYHKNITEKVLDAGGRNSLSLVPTILDYIDISEENYFLGASLFGPKHSEVICDTIFYDSYYRLSTEKAQMESLTEEQYIEFIDLLVKYFSIKSNSNKDIKINSDYVTAIVSEDCSTMTITMRCESEHQYKNVWFPVWSDINNQDDLVWYQAIQDDDGDWCFTVDLSMHNSIGSYTVHVYEGDDEPQSYIGAATAYVSDYPPDKMIVDVFEAE